MKIPKLLCKIHKKDSVIFCKEHRDWICIECYALHSDHFDQTAKGTSEHICKILKKMKKVVVK